MLSDRYSQLIGEIALHAKNAGRDPASIQLVAITKYATLEQMQEAYRLGISHFGESRLQTALSKMPHFPSDVKWHFIGPLQSNKVGKIATHFDYIHSLSSYEMGQRIAEKSNGVQVFLQVNTSKEVGKQGFTEEGLWEEFSQIAELKLNLIGLMTMAPLTSDTVVIKRCFHQLKVLGEKLSLPHLSMGMSQDFSTAIAEGATFLRIGSYLFN